MSTPHASAIHVQTSGAWQVIARPDGGEKINLTRFRGAPTKVSALSTTDPFGPAVATVVFPKVSVLDALWEGDLAPLAPLSDIDICWVYTDQDGRSSVRYVWEGYLLSPDWSEEGLVYTCQGAMRQLDDTLAKPAYLYQPLPYEVALARLFLPRPDLRLAPMRTEWPSWWDTRFDASKYPANRPWLLPAGVATGALWSALVTRETGHWEPSLTSYAQGLLANMQTSRGQWTLRLEQGRVPVLTHRDHLASPGDGTLVVDLLWPGVKINPSLDYSQRVDVVYAQGKAANGDVYTGMQVSADGSSTWYEPAAYRRQAHPSDRSNPWLDPSLMRKEVMLNFPDGLDASEARAAAMAYQSRFATPGITGSLILTTDPIAEDGTPFPRQLVAAGSSILVKGLFGRSEGVLMHVTESNVSEDSTTLTVDTMFRDQLTVDQIRKRGRDALVPFRMLSTAGTYDPKIPDLLFPWSYAAGGGVIPYDAHPLFEAYGPRAAGAQTAVADPYAVPFPWTEYTRAYPPSRCPYFYVVIPPADRSNANLNWANALRGNSSGQDALSKFAAYPVQLSAAGEIKLVQIAAYDGDGNVKPVPFHVSLYYESSVSYTSMPMIPVGTYRQVTTAATVSLTSGSTTVTVTGLPKGHGIEVGELFTLECQKPVREASGQWTAVTVGAKSLTFALATGATKTASGLATVRDPAAKGVPYDYDAGQHYPFFPDAWEKILADGRTPTNAVQVTAAATLIAGWGTGYEMAGFWPGSSGDADRATGMLVDEIGFSYDFRNRAGGVSVYDTPEENMKTPNRVRAYVMIYCDADDARGTFFLGRVFRKEYQAS